MVKTVTYEVRNMRVTRPKGKVAEKNPDRFATITGVFYDAKGTKLSIVSKNVTLEEAMVAETIIDPINGILTMPAGERGRKRAEGESAEDIFAALNALRGIEPDESDENSEENSDESVDTESAEVATA